jgi:phosphomannomutase
MSAESSLIVSVSGIRGIVGNGLTAEIATAFAQALATHCACGRIVVSQDGRSTGDFLRHAVLAGLLGAGCEVQDLGIVPTPTCGLAVRRLNARGGIQITASHNPPEWNGLKLFAPDGAVLNAAQGQEIKSVFQEKTFVQTPWNKVGKASHCPDATAWHRQRVLELIDVARIRGCGLRVFLDANNGAGGLLGATLLEALGCRPVCHACDADGNFLHGAEPIAENLREVCPLISQAGCDIGFVLDPDADRLAIIDEAGGYIGEELTLALATVFRLGHERGSVVLNMSTSRTTEDIAKRYGCPCFRAAVGEANVVERMRAVGAILGGEGNGGVIDPRVGWVRDPFIGMGLILNLLADTGKRLSELVAELPAYEIVKTKCQLEPDQWKKRISTLLSRWPEARVNQEDGLRLDWDERWVHIRPSNTEPVTRIIAEAHTRQEAETLCRAVTDLL